MNWDEYVADQLLVAGSYALAEGLESAALGGAVYDGGIEGPLVSNLAGALTRSGELTATSGNTASREDSLEGHLEGPLVQEKKRGHPYPLGFLDTSVPSAFLDAAYESASSGGTGVPVWPAKARMGNAWGARPARTRRNGVP